MLKIFYTMIEKLIYSVLWGIAIISLSYGWMYNKIHEDLKVIELITEIWYVEFMVIASIASLLYVKYLNRYK